MKQNEGYEEKKNEMKMNDMISLSDYVRIWRETNRNPPMNKPQGDEEE